MLEEHEASGKTMDFISICLRQRGCSMCEIKTTKLIVQTTIFDINNTINKYYMDDKNYKKINTIPFKSTACYGCHGDLRMLQNPDPKI